MPVHPPSPSASTAKTCACPASRSRRLMHAPAMCWRTAPAPAWRTRSCRRSPRVSRSAASRPCVISSPTWKRDANAPIRRRSRTRPCVPPSRRRNAAFPKLPLFAGGKSFGGRMTSQAQAVSPLPGVRGLVFLGFPLHPAKQTVVRARQASRRRAVPMLFLQGTRDALAELDQLEPVCKALGSRATLRLFEHADHSFHVPARTGETMPRCAPSCSMRRRSGSVPQAVIDGLRGLRRSRTSGSARAD